MQLQGRLLHGDLAAAVGGRPGPLGGAVGEVVLEVGLAGGAGRREHVHLLLEGAARDQQDVGGDARLLDGDVAGGEVLGDGQLEGGRILIGLVRVVHVVEHLHRALAEGLPADHQRPVVVLEGAGHDLAGRGGVRVHDEHQRNVDDVAGLGVGLLHLVDGDRGVVGVADRLLDHALGEEQVGDLDGLVEEAPRVVAQVEDDAGEVAAGLGTLGGQRLLEVAGGVSGELGEPHVADVAGQEPRLRDRLHVDHLAGHAELPRLAAGPLHRDRDLGLRAPPQPVDGLLQVEVHGGLLVDAGDDVLGLDAGPLGGGVLEHLHHREGAVAHADDEAEAAELAPGLELHLLRVLGLEEDGVRVERGEHAVRGGVLDLAQVLLGHQVRLDEAHGLAQLGADLPDAVHARDVELALGGAHGQGQARGARVTLDHHLRDPVLDALQRRDQHLLGAEARRVHVVVLHRHDDPRADRDAVERVVAAWRTGQAWGRGRAGHRGRLGLPHLRDRSGLRPRNRRGLRPGDLDRWPERRSRRRADGVRGDEGREGDHQSGGQPEETGHFGGLGLWRVRGRGQNPTYRRRIGRRARRAQAERPGGWPRTARVTVGAAPSCPARFAARGSEG